MLLLVLLGCGGSISVAAHDAQVSVEVEKMRTSIRDLCSITGEGDGELSRLYRTYFNPVDNFNRQFYMIGPPRTQGSEQRRVFTNSLSSHL